MSPLSVAINETSPTQGHLTKSVSRGRQSSLRVSGGWRRETVSID